MDFTINNGLSMTGGDELDEIQEQIVILDASVVHKVGNLTESIDGVKTFTSAFNVNTAGSVILTSDDIQLNNAVGNAGVDVNATGVLMGAPSTGDVTIIDTTTFETLAKFSDTETIIRAPNGGSTLDIQGALMRIDGSSGGVNQLFFGAVEPFSSISFQNTDMEFLNTDIVVSTDATDTTQKQIGISATSTTAGDLILLLNKRTGTGSDFTASGYRMIRENSTGDFVLQRRTISSGGISTFTAIQRISGTTSETFTMPTQTKVATTAFKVQNVAGTDRLLISPTLYLLQSAPLSSLQIYSGTFSIFQAGTTMAITSGDTMELSAGTSLAGSVGGTQKLNMTTTATTITNATINLQDATPTTRFTQTNGTTDITNTSINAVGRLYASSYSLGRSTASSLRLASIQLPLGTISIPTGSSTPVINTGNWSQSGTSLQMRTPEWGNFYPLYAMIGFDNGTITGGGTMTIAIRIREETNNYDYSTDAFTLTSGTNNAPTGGAGDFTTFTAGSNSRISGGVLIRCQILLTRTANISASTKSCYFTAYGYQTT
jgi:hypothetical protein